MSDKLVVYRYWKKIVYPDFDAEISSAIEWYRHVFREIMSIWGNVEEFNKYTDSLILMESDRIVDWKWRSWFSFGAMSDLNLLMDVHNEVYWLPKNELNSNWWDKYSHFR